MQITRHMYHSALDFSFTPDILGVMADARHLRIVNDVGPGQAASSPEGPPPFERAYDVAADFRAQCDRQDDFEQTLYGPLPFETLRLYLGVFEDGQTRVEMHYRNRLRRIGTKAVFDMVYGFHDGETREPVAQAPAMRSCRKITEAEADVVFSAARNTLAKKRPPLSSRLAATGRFALTAAFNIARGRYSGDPVAEA